MPKYFSYDFHYWKRPANNLIKAIQTHVVRVMENNEAYKVFDIVSLEKSIHQFIEENEMKFSKCPVKDISVKVLKSYVEVPWDSLSVRHRNDNISDSVHVRFIPDTAKYLVKFPDETFITRVGPFNTVYQRIA